MLFHKLKNEYIQRTAIKNSRVFNKIIFSNNFIIRQKRLLIIILKLIFTLAMKEVK